MLTSKVNDVLFNDTEVGTACTACTVTLQLAVFPFAVFTVIVAVPTCFAVTLPLPSTVATLVFELLQVHFLFAAFDGYTVALRFEVFPVSSVKVVLLRATEVGVISSETGAVENSKLFAFAY